MFPYATVEEDLLTDDLFEDSARIYHRNTATIQRVFTEQWFTTLHDLIGKEQIEHADANPALVEACVVAGLTDYRQALRAKAGEMIAGERDKRAARDSAIWAYARRAAATHA